MLFDEDDNEISAFTNVPGLYQKSKTRICWFHRGTLKLQSLYRNLRQSKNEHGVTVVKKFEVICNVISDGVETEEEYKLLYNMAKIWIEGASVDGSITTLQCSDLLHNLSAIGNRCSEISNHKFMNVRSLVKRTTNSNNVVKKT